MFMFRKRRSSLTRRLEKVRKRRGDEAEARGLLKQLNYDQLEILCAAVESRGRDASNCVLLPPEGQPHVLCCQTWRWPDVHDAGLLRRLPTCSSATDPVYICCNPFHWSRICVPDSPPPPYTRFAMERLKPEASPKESENEPLILAEVIAKANGDSTTCISPDTEVVYANTASHGDGNAVGNSTAIWDSWSPGLLRTTKSFALQTQNNQLHALSVQISDVPVAATSPNEALPGADRAPSEAPIVCRDTYPGSLTTDGEDSMMNPREWCKLAYWELAQRVGPLYPVEMPSVNVFGDVPFGDGLCLKTLALHSFSPPESVRRTRCKIGLGVTLSREDDGIWVYNRSDNPVFVNSLTLEDPESPSPTKVPAEHCLCVFDPIKAAYQNYGWNFANCCGPVDFNSVRISFVKGWGRHYSRQEITSCPCWLEILLAPCR